MSTALTEFQDRFVQGLLGASDSADLNLRALTQQPGFHVYRNTVIKGLVDALQANYPAVQRLVGEEFFRAVAVLYATQHPPQDARLLQYGEHFAEFLQNFEPAKSWPYLGNVARLDRCWTEVHIAADAPAISASDLASLGPEALEKLVLRPHPATRWLWVDDQPVFTLWQRSRSARNEDDAIGWVGEGALLTRPDGAVQWTTLDRAGCALLALCSSGQPIAQNLQRLQADQPNTDLSTLMATLLRVGALTSDLPTAAH